MPSAFEHLRQAERNESLYREICQLHTSEPEYTEWEIVVLFYSVVHHIEAYRDMREGRHSDNHSQRNRYIRETEEFREIWPAYSYLYRLGINARYESMSFSAEEVRGLEANQFNFIKQHVRSLIGA